MSYVQDVLDHLQRRNPSEPEFLQAAREVLERPWNPSSSAIKNFRRAASSSGWSNLNGN